MQEHALRVARFVLVICETVDMKLLMRRLSSYRILIWSTTSLWFLPVAIASAPQPEPDFRTAPAFYLASVDPRITPVIVEPLLIARVDGPVDYAQTGFSTTFRESGSPPAPAEQAATASDRRFGVGLPHPDRWAALLATFALGLFFFARRI